MFKKFTPILAIAVILALVLAPGLVSTAQASNGSTNWAIVISGGSSTASPGSNHARYWNDLSEMYEILTGTYGYTDANIFVLYADGNPPTAANCDDPANAHASYPTGIIDYAATTANIDTVTDYIAANGHCGDTLFVFTTDHGAASGALTLWGESISPATFAGPGYIGKITQYCWRAFEMEQCYSGAFVAPLSGPRTLIATACRDDEGSCGAGAELFYYDPFCYYFNAALKGALPGPAGGTAVDADVDNDGKVSFVEAFNYAQANDYCAEEPQYDDDGDGTSHTGQMPAGGDGTLGSVVFLAETRNPVADAGEDQIVEQTYYQGADVTLDGSGSFDPDGDAITYAWTWSGGSATGVSPTVSLPLGTTTVTLLVNDGILDSCCPDTVDITIVDTTPPSVDAGPDITVEQETLAGTEVTLSALVSDICDPSPMVAWSHGPTYVFPLGDTTVTVTATDTSGNVGSDTVVVSVVDTTAPEVFCVETVNPHGKNVPPAGKTTLPGPKGGQNEDGFYQLLAEDICDPAPEIFVVDTGSGCIFGPFDSGVIIKYTEDSEATPEAKKMGSSKGQAGAVTVHIIGNGDPCVTAVDFSGNVADCVSCLVPGEPK
jgi:hypothetical protein